MFLRCHVIERGLWSEFILLCHLRHLILYSSFLYRYHYWATTFLFQMLNLAKVKRLKYQVRISPLNASVHVFIFLDYVTNRINIAGFLSTTLHSSNDPDCIQSISGHHIAPTMLQFAKTRKLSIERADPRQYVFHVSFHHYKYFVIMQVLLRFILNYVEFPLWWKH